MKKNFKKLSCALLAAVMICVMTPLAASASSTIYYKNNQTLYMAGKNKPAPYSMIFISGVPNETSISKSSIKVVSGKSVIALSDLTTIKNNSYTSYFEKGFEPMEYKNHYFAIGVDAKKAGTGKISFEVENKTYTSTIKVMPYVNPISKFTVTGVKNGTSSNLAGKFKTNSSGGSLRVNKAQKNGYITCKAASGWKITSISFWNKKTNFTRRIASINGLNKSTGVSSLSLYVGSLKAKQTGTITINLYNAKTGGIQDCTIKLK